MVLEHVIGIMSDIGRKTISIFISISKKDVLTVEINGRRIHVGALKLIANYSEEFVHEFDYIRNFIENLTSRASRNRRYAITTCIDGDRIATYLLVLSESKDEIDKELEIVDEVIKSISRNAFWTERVEGSELIKVTSLCYGGSFLSLGLIHKNAKIENASFVAHLTGVKPKRDTVDVLSLDFISDVFRTGRIELGHVHGYENIRVRIRDDHVFRHIAIYGATGSGKSTTAAVLAVEAARNGYAVLVVDWHGEYETLLKDSDVEIVVADIQRNIVPEDLELSSLIKKEPLAFIEVLESALDLTPAQAHVLEDAVSIYRSKDWVGYPIDIIAELISASAASARWYVESREALLRKLKPLTSQYLSINWSKVEKVSIKKGRLLLFNVSSIPNVRVRKILTTLLIRNIALKAQYNEIEKPIMIVVDEAHNVFDENNPIAYLIAEVRKWNIGFVVISQAPSMLASVVIKNTNTKIVHSIKSSQDLNVIMANIVGGRDIAKKLSTLRPGEAYLFLPEIEMPIPIKVDIDLIKGRKSVDQW